MDNRAKNAFVAPLMVLLFATGTLSADPTVAVASPAGDAATAPAAAVPSNKGSAPVKAVAANSDPTKPVRIHLYYESLCQDTVNFVDQQLVPNYEKFSKFIDITYNPFSQGQIKVVDNKTVYTCPREGECDADRVHSCAIAHVSSEENLLKFVHCALDEGIKTKTVPIETCAKNSNITADIIGKISECFNGSEGYSFLNGYKEKAVAANVTNVPHIVINDVYSDENQKLAQTDFKKVMCLQISPDNRPEECKDVVGGSSTLVVGVLPIFISVFYIIKMF